MKNGELRIENEELRIENEELRIGMKKSELFGTSTSFFIFVL
jgi:hypothetical protein